MVLYLSQYANEAMKLRLPCVKGLKYTQACKVHARDMKQQKMSNLVVVVDIV